MTKKGYGGNYMLIVDGHCDTVQVALDKNVDLENESLSFNSKQAIEKAPILQMMAAFINPTYEKPFQRACDIIQHFERQLEKYPKELLQVKKKEDILRVEQEKKIGCLLTIENGRAVEGNLENVDYFYTKGVKVMSITWNEDNLLGCGALTKQDNGLTQFGKEYVQKLNRKKIVVDVSHSSEKTFWDAIKINEGPIVATHSCCYSLCQHPRNLRDEQIKQIAKSDGIIGVCYCTKFLSETGVVGTKEIAKHIAYIANLVGTDYVGLGSDFDGLDEEEVPTDLRNVGQIDNLIQALREVGFHENEIEKVMGRNWLSVLEKFI